MGLRSATRRARTRLRSQTTATKLHPMTDMTPSPLRVRKERSDLLPDGNSAQRRWPWRPPWPSHPTLTAVTSPGSDTITRARRHAASSPALGGAGGCSPRSSGAIAAPASWFLELLTDLQEGPSATPAWAQQHRAPVRRQQPVWVHRAWRGFSGSEPADWSPPSGTHRCPILVVLGLTSGQLPVPSKHHPGVREGHSARRRRRSRMDFRSAGRPFRFAM